MKISVFENVSKKQDAKYLASELNMLNDREKLIMTLRYGLNNTKEYTQKEVATMLGISQKLYFKNRKKSYKKNQRNN